MEKCQICLAKKSLNNFTVDYPGLVALFEGFVSTWGRPPLVGEANVDYINSHEWFAEEMKNNPDIQWPRFYQPKLRLIR